MTQFVLTETFEKEQDHFWSQEKSTNSCWQEFR